ncbi:MAG: tripartite tricarboxylate transporter substrate-binding protein [Comamonas sp.]
MRNLQQHIDTGAPSRAATTGPTRWTRKSWLRAAAGLAAGACMAGSWGTAAAAGDPMHVLVPFPAGGAADFVARILADKLRVELDRPVLIENKPGAGGRVAAEALKQAKPDGKTVLLSAMEPLIIAPAIYPNLRFNPNTDFTPVTDVASFVFCVVVAGNSPYNNLAEYLQAARTTPENAMIGITSPGSIGHFFAYDFGRTVKLDKISMVPFQGAPGLITNLIGGQVPAVIDGSTAFAEQHRNKKLRILALSSTQRLPGLPDVPTFAESGYPSLVASATTVLYAPAATPQPQMAMWHQAMRKVLAQPDVRAKLQRNGYIVSEGASSQEVVDKARGVAERLLPIVKATGFKGD